MDLYGTDFSNHSSKSHVHRRLFKAHRLNELLPELRLRGFFVMQPDPNFFGILRDLSYALRGRC